ncbi:MAG: hypothetical protein XXXJIFNMEKO3_01466 [Candidatus Erwinia impunctatus]|nr:hypothetical protein XXXJIFNMEKO_01466 [Culicoides impunctatus]
MKAPITEKTTRQRRKTLDTLQQSLSQAQTWLLAARKENDVLEREAEWLTLRLARTSEQVQRLQQQEERQDAIGFIGASLSGKAWLAEGVAQKRHEENKPVSGVSSHFTSDVHPPLTSLRFSTSASAPAAAPLQLTLLQEHEVIVVLIMAWQERHTTKSAFPVTGTMTSKMQRALNARQTTLTGGITEQQVIALWESLEILNAGRQVLPDLGVWYGLWQILPFLTIEDRATLLAPWWGEDETLTQLYRQLAYALKQMAFSETVFANEDLIGHPTVSLFNGTLPVQDVAGNEQRVTVSVKKGRSSLSHFEIATLDLLLLCREIVFSSRHEDEVKPPTEADRVIYPSEEKVVLKLSDPVVDFLTARKRYSLLRNAQYQEMDLLVV